MGENLLNLRAVRFPHIKDDTLWNYIVEECSRLGIHAGSVWVKLEENRDGIIEPKFITTIQALRTIAQNSKLWDGETSPQYCGPDEVWKDIWLSDEPPMAARASVMRKDVSTPFEGKALFKQCAQWRVDESRMPVLLDHWELGSAPMLGKCALVAAYRAAFHAYIGGLLSQEESDPDAPPRTPPAATASVLDVPDDPKFAWKFVTDSTPDSLRGLRLALLDRMDSSAAVDAAIEKYRDKLPRLYGSNFTAFAAVTIKYAS